MPVFCSQRRHVPHDGCAPIAATPASALGYGMRNPVTALFLSCSLILQSIPVFPSHPANHRSLPQTTSFAFGLEEDENIILADRPLDVSDNRPTLVVQELDAHLRDTTSRAGSANDAGHADEFDARQLLLDNDIHCFGLNPESRRLWKFRESRSCRALGA